MKPKVTEEFLWKIDQIIQRLGEAYESSLPYGMSRNILNPEMESLRREYERKKNARTFSQFISYLRQKGYIKIPEGYSVYEKIQLTPQGRKKALYGKVAEKKNKLKSRKDGKMIMFMFDIPQNKEKARHMLRDILKFLDYQVLQKSVWISDKDVLEETEQSARELGLQEYVNIFVVDRVVRRK